MWILVHICTSKVKVIFELAQLGADKIQQQSIYMYMHTYTENMFSRLYGAVTSKGSGRGGTETRARASLHSCTTCDEFDCLLLLLLLLPRQGRRKEISVGAAMVCARSAPEIFTYINYS